MNQIIRNSEVVVLLAFSAMTESLFANYLPVALYLDLPLIFTLYVGWCSSPARGAACGIGFGWLQDAIAGIYLGLNGLTKTLMGFTASYLSKWLGMGGLLVRCVLIGLLSLVDDLLVMGIRALLGQTIQQEVEAVDIVHQDSAFSIVDQASRRQLGDGPNPIALG